MTHKLLPESLMQTLLRKTAPMILQRYFIEVGLLLNLELGAVAIEIKGTTTFRMRFIGRQTNASVALSAI